MNIPHSMALIIQRSHSLEEILQSAVELIAEAMSSNVCTIYLLDPASRRLRLVATHGLDPAALGTVALEPGEGITGRVVEQMRCITVDDASLHPGYRYFPETREERFHSYLGVPLAIRNRPMGAIVVQTTERRTYTEEECQTLSAIAAQLVGVVDNARLIEALDRGEEGRDYLAELRGWHARGAGSAARGRKVGETVFHGSAASPGIAIGRALWRGSHDVDARTLDRRFRGEEEELSLLAEAVEKSRAEIIEIQEAAEQQADEEHALVFASHLLLLNDRVLFETVRGSIREGKPAARAVYDALEQFSNRLLAVADPYIRERVEDIWDLRTRLLGHLTGRERKKGRLASQAPGLGGQIVVSGSIAPSLVVELKAQGAAGIITERGGPTSHGALLARSMGIPAVTGVSSLAGAVRSGDRLVLDGEDGTIVVNPSPETLARYEKKAHELGTRALKDLSYCSLPARTREGRRVAVLANIAVSADLPRAKEKGAEGVGLYRTEFPFMIREDFPTREEQVHIYRKAFESFPEGPLHFRLLDIGGDKIISGSSLAVDSNPFRGYRSVRVLLDEPAILRHQVQAFVLASGGRPFSILIPMVSTLGELRSVLEHVREAIADMEGAAGHAARRPPEMGVMIELPAAVELAGALARHVDFLSIGSNDLIQYTLAADRENARAAAHATPYHPAVLRLIQRTIRAGHDAGKKVMLCGEMAGQPPLALALVALGINALSVAPDTIPKLKRAIVSAHVGELEKEIDAILALDEASAIEEALRSHAAPEKNVAAG